MRLNCPSLPSKPEVEHEPNKIDGIPTIEYMTDTVMPCQMK